MAKILTVDLKGRVADGKSITFLRAEMNGAMATPFALIRYALNGEEQRLGLRIDLDKRSIFDRVDDPETDEAIERAAPVIADLLYPVAAERDQAIYEAMSDESKDSGYIADLIEKALDAARAERELTAIFKDLEKKARVGEQVVIQKTRRGRPRHLP